MTIEKPIHNGDNTHHHDQSILPISFRVMNTIVRSPQNPIPPFDDEDDDAIFLFPFAKSVMFYRIY